MTSEFYNRPRPNGRMVLRNGFILTPECSHSLLRKDILIEGERIACIGTDMPPEAQEIDAAGMIVMPGFVDAHRHCWQGALRGAAIDTDLMGYFARVIHRFGPHYSPEDVYVGTLASAVDAIDAGITTIYDWAHIVNSLDHSDAGIEALAASGIRAIWGYGFPNTRPEWSWRSDLPLPHAEARHIRKTRLFSDDARITMGLALRGPELSNMAVVESDWSLAKELAVPPSVHIGNTPEALADEPVGKLQERDLLMAGAHYVHTNWLSAEDRRRIAGSGGSVVVTPSVEMAMGFGQPAILANLKAGLKPGLGVDVTTTASGDMFSEIRAALWSSRMSGVLNETSVSASDALSFATLDAARAIGLGDRTGSITAGKQADLIMLKMGVPPAAQADPAGYIATFGERRHVDTVIVAGTVLKHGGKLLGCDKGQLTERLNRSYAQLLDRTRRPSSHTAELASKRSA